MTTSKKSLAFPQPHFIAISQIWDLSKCLVLIIWAEINLTTCMLKKKPAGIVEEAHRIADFFFCQWCSCTDMQHIMFYDSYGNIMNIYSIYFQLTQLE